jgi:hypothetical protein
MRKLTLVDVVIIVIFFLVGILLTGYRWKDGDSGHWAESGLFVIVVLFEVVVIIVHGFPIGIDVGLDVGLDVRLDVRINARLDIGLDIYARLDIMMVRPHVPHGKLGIRLNVRLDVRLDIWLDVRLDIRLYLQLDIRLGIDQTLAFSLWPRV